MHSSNCTRMQPSLPTLQLQTPRLCRYTSLHFFTTPHSTSFPHHHDSLGLTSYVNAVVGRQPCAMLCFYSTIVIPLVTYLFSPYSIIVTAYIDQYIMFQNTLSLYSTRGQKARRRSIILLIILITLTLKCQGKPNQHKFKI